MLATIRNDFSKAKLTWGDGPLLLILAFVSMQLVSLSLWSSPLLFSNAGAVPSQALLGQIALFILSLGLVLALRVKRPNFLFWPLTSGLITIYLLWLMVLRADLAFSVGCLVCIFCLIWTNFSNRLGQSSPIAKAPRQPQSWKVILALSLLGTALFIHLFFMGRLSLCRVWGMSTPSYDFGLFNQMFAYMKETGLPLTTLERDGLYSHFQVHFSPIYYLILPFYALFPKPETLQIAQLVIVCSGVIPLLLLARHFHLPYLIGAGIGAAYLLQPGLMLGSFYDLHENCFLAPIICWLFLAIFQARFWPSIFWSVMLLMVKEDAALYLLSAALFVFFSPLLRQQRYQVWPGSDTKKLSLSARLLALILAGLALLGFTLISSFLQQAGEGLMSYRFAILQQYGGQGLAGIIRSVFQNPAQVLSLIFGPEKLNYLLTLALATGFLPFLQTARSHYLLFLPLLVMNLATDYPYQYNILFQYNFGSHSFLILALLLALVGPKLPKTWPKNHKTGIRYYAVWAVTPLLLLVAIIGAGWLSLYNIQDQAFYVDKYQGNPQYYQEIRAALEDLPRDPVIGADTFSTTFLADCPQLYDLKFNETAATGSRDLDLVVWAPSRAMDWMMEDTEYSPILEMYRAKGYVDRPDLSGQGLITVLSKPELVDAP